MPAFRPNHPLSSARLFRAGAAVLALLASAAVSARAAALTAAQLDEIERSILPLRHGYDRHEALAAFASQEGATRDDMSAALVAIVERRPPSTNRVDAIREFAIAELAIFGGTNALPVLRRLALDPAEPNAWEAVGSYYAIAGFTPETLAWAEGFLIDEKTEDMTRQSLFRSVFRHSLDGDDLAPAERDALGRCLLRVTEAADDSPAWTDQVLCRAFPDYAGSAERRARLEAALARLPPPAPASERKGALPDGTEFVRRDLTNALATAVATNPVPFSIPVLRSPPAPRVLPDTFVLPEIPQEWRE